MMHPERKFHRRAARKHGTRAVGYLRGALSCRDKGYAPIVWESHVEWAVSEARASWRNALKSEQYPASTNVTVKARCKECRRLVRLSPNAVDPHCGKCNSTDLDYDEFL